MLFYELSPLFIPDLYAFIRTCILRLCLCVRWFIRLQRAQLWKILFWCLEWYLSTSTILKLFWKEIAWSMKEDGLGPSLILLQLTLFLAIILPIRSPSLGHSQHFTKGRFISFWSRRWGLYCSISYRFCFSSSFLSLTCRLIFKGRDLFRGWFCFEQGFISRFFLILNSAMSFYSNLNRHYSLHFPPPLFCTPAHFTSPFIGEAHLTFHC